MANYNENVKEKQELYLNYASDNAGVQTNTVKEKQ